MDEWGFLQGQKYLIFDRDTKFCTSFREIVRCSGVQLIRPPPMSPNLNAYAERFVRTIKEECLSQLILPLENTCVYVAGLPLPLLRD